jgi:cytosine/adenosine deaminase-related metal-dependent hydrolase
MRNRVLIPRSLAEPTMWSDPASCPAARQGPRGTGPADAEERIQRVLDPGEPAPEVLEVPGHTLLPGLIDCHTHLAGE